MIPYSMPGPIAVLIQGAPINHAVGNGTSVLGTIIPAIVNGGITPITLDWSKTGALGVTLSASNSTELKYLATGTDQDHIGTLQVIATDAAGYAITASTDFEVTQGTPP